MCAVCPQPPWLCGSQPHKVEIMRHLGLLELPALFDAVNAWISHGGRSKQRPTSHDPARGKHAVYVRHLYTFLHAKCGNAQFDKKRAIDEHHVWSQGTNAKQILSVVDDMPVPKVAVAADDARTGAAMGDTKRSKDDDALVYEPASTPTIESVDTTNEHPNDYIGELTRDEREALDLHIDLVLRRQPSFLWDDDIVPVSLGTATSPWTSTRTAARSTPIGTPPRTNGLTDRDHPHRRHETTPSNDTVCASLLSPQTPTPSVVTTPTEVDESCIICMCRPQTHVAIPCGHLAVCEYCLAEQSDQHRCVACLCSTTAPHFVQVVRVTCS